MKKITIRDNYDESSANRDAKLNGVICSLRIVETSTIDRRRSCGKTRAFRMDRQRERARKKQKTAVVR